MGSQVSNVAKDWHWALRVSSPESVSALFRDLFYLLLSPLTASPVLQVTPGLGLIAVLLLLFVVKEPKRGAIEARPEHHLHQTSWLTDLKALSKKWVQLRVIEEL